MYYLELASNTDSYKTLYSETMQIINKIMDYLIEIHIENSKLKHLKLTDLQLHIKEELLKTIVRANYDNIYCNKNNKYMQYLNTKAVQTHL